MPEEGAVPKGLYWWTSALAWLEGRLRQGDVSRACGWHEPSAGDVGP